MKEILPADKTAVRILAEQEKRPGKKYRLATYCAKRKVPGGLLLYNNLTKRLILLSEDEILNDGSPGSAVSDGLTRDWFLVPEEQDDNKLARELRAVAADLKRSDGSITSYTIFTTTECNARCFYCYERGRGQMPMSDETADKTVAFIMEHSAGKAVTLGWFGGEPLYNMGVIDRICLALENGGIKYQSSMISNGYLFDADIVRKAKESWSLRKVQITLDGTEEVYNRSKAYIYKNGISPYVRVMNNIGLLLDAGIRVNIRLNVGRDNGDDLPAVVDELAERFAGRGKLCVYAKPILEHESGSVDEYGWKITEGALEPWVHLREQIERSGLGGGRRLSRQIRTGCCMADNDHAVTVLPDGRLGKCEHFSEREFIGSLYEEKRDGHVAQSWKEPGDDKPICEGCVCYPDCVRLRKCPSGRACLSPEKKAREEDLAAGMLAEYEIHRKMEEEKES